MEEIEPVEEDDCIIIADEPVNSSPPPPPVPTDPFSDALQILQLTMDEVFEGSRMHGKEDCSKNTDCWPGRCTLTVEAQPRTFVETLKQMRWCSKILLLGWMSIVASLYMWKARHHSALSVACSFTRTKKHAVGACGTRVFPRHLRHAFRFWQSPKQR